VSIGGGGLQFRAGHDRADAKSLECRLDDFGRRCGFTIHEGRRSSSSGMRGGGMRGGERGSSGGVLLCKRRRTAAGSCGSDGVASGSRHGYCVEAVQVRRAACSGGTPSCRRRPRSMFIRLGETEHFLARRALNSRRLLILPHAQLSIIDPRWS
jgi:hypothetical protein